MPKAISPRGFVCAQAVLSAFMVANAWAGLPLKLDMGTEGSPVAAGFMDHVMRHLLRFVRFDEVIQHLDQTSAQFPKVPGDRRFQIEATHRTHFTQQECQRDLVETFQP